MPRWINYISIELIFLCSTITDQNTKCFASKAFECYKQNRMKILSIQGCIKRMKQEHTRGILWNYIKILWGELNSSWQW